ncbi:fatty-acyl-CoA synthase [Neohortaea acidophila]|uniref:Very long-chain fatty acid transport protein n=1 Tax=Neohortaea acidophila TaxID=245834 RepID=A0A6A6PWA8_9PEZI|nr:fatty-acyl-CoA synthase [Neohortaea acidophila]KAF2483763.1 fatty-acyl-CoA synthase [Neohortaea acidophila]
MVLALAAGGVAAAAYLNGKYQLSREVKGLIDSKKSERAWERRLQANRTAPWYLVEEVCQRQPHIRALWTRERSWTYDEMYSTTLQMAQWMLEQGVRPGDLVALYLRNSAEFMMLMFATFAIGASVAPINYNLEGRALMHCLTVVESRLLIVDADEECRARVEGSRGEMEKKGVVAVVLDDALKRDFAARPVVKPDDALARGVKPSFPYVILFTSGTTGMPKATPFIISRFVLNAPLEPSFGAKPEEDCWYQPMPLYHGTGLIVGSYALLSGIGLAIPSRFSVSQFWPDIHDSGSTFFVYVGETARYLLAAPPHPLDRAHRMKLAYGNGLRPDVWDKMRERFNIPEILEFFSSSEGLMTLHNHARNTYLSGCVGHHGLINRIRNRNYFIPVRIDHETGDIWRDPRTGFAQRVPYEQGGEILVGVEDRTAFAGYWNNSTATEKRFATDVFKQGDLYYRSGDALRRDTDGCWYFLDRLGDTYRWHSENVSTAEVAEVLGRYGGIAEANVYGVLVPGHEGRAGCAAIHLESGRGEPDYVDLVRYARKQLPGYAVPVFLRVVKRSSHIHNHKQNKVGLRKEGVDPGLLGTEEKEGMDDGFLWRQPGQEGYVPFRKRDWEGLVHGKVRL